MSIPKLVSPSSGVMAGLKRLLLEPVNFTWFKSATSSQADAQFEETKRRIHRNNPDTMLEDAIKGRDLNLMTEAERMGAPLVAAGFNDPLTQALEGHSQAVTKHLLKLIEIRAQKLDTSNPSAADDLRRFTKETLTKRLATLVNNRSCDTHHLKEFEFLLQSGADITKNAAYGTGFYYATAANGLAEQLDLLEQHRRNELIRLASKGEHLSLEEKSYQSSLTNLPHQKGTTEVTPMQRIIDFVERTKLRGEQMLQLVKEAISFTPPQRQSRPA
jgi:hypothetical protein